MEFIEQLIKAVQREKEALIKDYAQKRSGSIAEQRKVGLCIYPLEVVEQTELHSSTSLVFKTSYPIEQAYFKKGSLVSLETDTEKYQCRLIELDTQQGTLVVDDADGIYFKEESFKLYYQQDDRTLLGMEIGCRLALENDDLKSILREIENPIIPSEINEFVDSQLNFSQQKACNSILGKGKLVSIQGPPGTGKTHLLTTSISKLVQRKESVIISAPSNAALDHLVKQLLSKGIGVLRVGNEEKMDSEVEPFTLNGYVEKYAGKELDQLNKTLRKEINQAEKHYRNYSSESANERRQSRKNCQEIRKEIRQLRQQIRVRVLNEVEVIAGTPIGLFNELPKTFRRSVVIIDEASQCSIPLTLLVASFAERLVICGDPQQLPPFVFDEEAGKMGLRYSLLERTIESAILLNEQYRMAPEIVEGINTYFYDNRLITVNQSKSGKLVFVDLAGFSNGEHQDELGGSTFHIEEAQLVKKMIEHFEFRSSNTLLITPYSAQLRKIQEDVGKAWRCSTIDAVQGQEAENCIISLTRSNENQTIGFLKDYRRTNVAISRAQNTCVILGDSATIGNDPFYKQLLEIIELQGGYHSAFEFI